MAITGQVQVVTTTPEPESRSLWVIFLAGIAEGFAALFMPCIFPMLPLTVSYFTKSSPNKGKAVIHASIYGLSIVAIYVLLAILITVIFRYRMYPLLIISVFRDSSNKIVTGIS